MNIFLNERISLLNGNWMIEDVELIRRNISTMLKTLCLIEYHKEASINYSNRELKVFTDNIEELEILNEYSLTDLSTQILVVLLNLDATNWETKKLQRTDCFYHYQNNLGIDPIPINETSIAEATEYQYNGQSVAVLNFISSEYNQLASIPINRVQINPPNQMSILQLSVINSKVELIRYVNSAQKLRNFNCIDKHGESIEVGRWWKNHEWASPLKCNRAQAHIFLQSAISINKSKDLFGFDNVREEIIVFKSEGSTLESNYHGYYPEKQDESYFEEIKRYFKEE